MSHTIHKRATILILALVAILMLGAGAEARPALHVGVHGKRVVGAQWLMQGHNPFRPRVRTYHGRIDGHYGRHTARAARRAKYLLGWPIQGIDGTFGWRLHDLLTGKRHLSTLSRQRRKRRLYALAHPHVGVVVLGPGCSGWRMPKPHVLVFAKLVALHYGHPLVCVSGYRPGSRVYGSGRVSMHSSGNAADLGTPTYAMNTAVGRAALIAAGMSPGSAARYYSFAGWYGGVNILFHTYIGGNHYNHVHTGEWSWPTGRRGFYSAMRQLSLYAINTEEPGAWNTMYHLGLTAPADSALGYAIVGVKRELAYQGYRGQMLLDTSFFGSAAKNEAIRFQLASGLTADGVIGPRTALVLFRQRAEAVALANGIPDHLVARQDSWESAHDPAAIGPSGQDFGLAQIYLPAHPNISKAQAISPAFALPWQGLQLRSSYGVLHDWDGALCAWNAGSSLATKWVAAGKPASGGPISSLGRDLFTVCYDYVRHVKASAW